MKYEIRIRAQGKNVLKKWEDITPQVKTFANNNEALDSIRASVLFYNMFADLPIFEVRFNREGNTQGHYLIF